jgi:alpha-tubulin suppressor-like RCC1 family protein
MEGTTTADRTCGTCVSGTYTSSPNQSSCTTQPQCSAGTYVTSAGSTSSPRVCTTCASGSYSTTTNASECTAYTTCPAGQYVSQAGTTQADRQCAGCATGTYTSTENASSCSAYSTCPAGVATAGTATSDTVCIPAVATLAIAGNQSFTVRTDGSLYGWGENGAKQLGATTATPVTTPVNVSGVANAKSVAAGLNHTCALLDGGSVVCWGSNVSGQLGNNSQTASTTPVAVSGLSNATAIVAGEAHSCALRSDNTVVCWGANGSGQVGDGTTALKLVPTNVKDVDNANITAIALASGNNHMCALRSDGTALCWGKGDNGQLGNGGTTGTNPKAIAVSSLSTATQLSAGAKHSCAVRSSGGTVVCWGAGGMIGDGTSTARTTPTVVSNVSGVLAVTSGEAHSCAVKSDRTVVCWGDGSEARFGSGAFQVTSTTAVAVKDLTTAVAVATGPNANHTCALRSDGSVMCWGSNGNGQVGNGYSNFSPVPLSVDGLVAPLPTSIFAGSDHTCSLRSNGTAMCWGYNENGQLGVNNLTTGKKTINPTSVGNLSDATAIDSGGAFNCALRSAGPGTVSCWGLGDNGRLGNGGTTSSSSPVNVQTDSNGTAFTGAKSVRTGTGHACAIKSNDAVVCWGLNNNGQLGSGGTVSQTRPVAPGVSAKLLAPGGTHTCVTLLDNSVTCWGAGTDGQLGNGVFAQSGPVATGLTNVQGLTSGLSFSCSLAGDKTVKCWGTNASGQLGNGSSVAKTATPVDLPDLSGITAISAGDSHACAFRSTDAAVWCWGDNSLGQLASRSVLKSHSPVSVTGLGNVTSIEAGRTHTCALRSDNTALCWGGGGQGQLAHDSITWSTVPSKVLW